MFNFLLLKYREELLAKKEKNFEEWEEIEHRWHIDQERKNTAIALLDAQIDNKKKLLEAYKNEDFINKEAMKTMWDNDVNMFRETIKTLEGVIKTFQEYETHCPAPQVTRKTGIQVDSNN